MSDNGRVDTRCLAPIDTI